MEAGLNVLMDYLIKVIFTTLSQLFILMGPGLFLALIMYFISDLARNRASDLLGYKFFIYFTAIGTIVHELGHALFAVLFGHTITEINLFGPNKKDGTLGYVNHRYNPKNIYQKIGNFFIGIGPIILGSVVIFFSAKYMLGNNVFLPISKIQISPDTFSSFQNMWIFIQDVLSNTILVIGMLFRTENLGNIWFYLFIYLVFAVGMHVKLSPVDLKGAWQGFVFLVILFLLFNFLTIWYGDFSIKYITLFSQSYNFFYAYMLFTIILILFFLIITVVIHTVKTILLKRN